MALKGLIARAGQGLLDILKLLMRGLGALYAVFVSALLFIFENSETESNDSDSEYGFVENDRIISNEEREAKNSGWTSW